MFTVVETPVYLRSIRAIWSDAEAQEVVDFLALHSDAGDVIPGTSGLRKLRWQRAGMGKRGGTRVIFYQQAERGNVVLLIAYTKAKFDDLPREYLNHLRELYDV